ncbi:MAG TPA: TlpA disulfide reductase family protein [Actinomycetota bacterium]|nr:TlpA disulfide reductase family protein [Actinomycetota bacterium]
MRRALALAALLSLALAACGQRGTTDATSDSLLPADRLALPTFDLPMFQALVEELEGAPVVVNFWGSWCPPCEGEAPGLATVASEFEGQAQFVGVDILDARAPAREFILRFDWPYPSLFDPTGAIRDGLGYVGQPITLIYDRQGILVFEWNGAIGESQLRREIRAVL